MIGTIRKIMRVEMMGVLWIFLCIGCTELNRNIEDSSTRLENKLYEFQAVLQKKLSMEEKKFPAKGGSESEAKNTKRPTEKQPLYYVYYTQHSWETFACVAEWFTGKPENQQTLAEVNPRINPDKIPVGTAIFIPTKMLKTRDPIPAALAAKYGPQYYKHTVRWHGETLSLIAKWYTGHSKNWRALAQKNPKLKPSRIRAGNVILIPPDLLKTRKPLPQKVAAKNTASYFAHKVQDSEEKLTDIARWYTGDAQNWKALAAANPNLNPRHLRVGYEIFIPAHLIKTRRPLPREKEATDVSKPREETEPEESPSPPAEEDELELFGPKQYPKG